MRLVLIPLALGLSLAASASPSHTADQTGFTGAWTFTWENDPNNTNHADLEQGTGTFTGTYINDAKEKCPLVGRMSSPTTVSLTIVCPDWEIKADGSITNSRLLGGSYRAYGSTSGIFTMLRK
ncbi:MAG: hypothetical protein ACREO1_04925 [Arenimonas sp.]